MSTLKIPSFPPDCHYFRHSYQYLLSLSPRNVLCVGLERCEEFRCPFPTVSVSVAYVVAHFYDCYKLKHFGIRYVRK